MRTDGLVLALRDAGLVAEPLELAEALWLAATVGGLTALGTAEPPVTQVPLLEDSPAGSPGDSPDGSPDGSPDDEPTLDLAEPLHGLSERIVEPVFEGVPLNLPFAGEPEAAEVAGQAVPVGRAPALPSRSALLRALRPLKRRIDVGR